MTIYMSKRDFRQSMRNPYSAERAHAICRRLVATSKQWPSLWYAAHYWAACAATCNGAWGETIEECLAQYANNFAYECIKEHNANILPNKYKSLWSLAVRRVLAIRDEALALSNSLTW